MVGGHGPILPSHHPNLLTRTQKRSSMSMSSLTLRATRRPGTARPSTAATSCASSAVSGADLAPAACGTAGGDEKSALAAQVYPPLISSDHIVPPLPS